MLCGAAVLLLLRGSVTAVGAQPLRWSPCSAQGKNRWAMKTRSVAHASMGTHTLTVAEVLDWDVPAGLKRAVDQVQDPREAKLLTVRGYVRLIKRAPEDCDIHIEIADWPGGNASRMIVEIPHRDPQLQQQILDIIGQIPPKEGLLLKGHDAPRITVTGYGFLDLWHYSSSEANAKKRAVGLSSHGSASVRTVWEVHPVLALR
jgi:hypothetical protein